MADDASREPSEAVFRRPVKRSRNVRARPSEADPPPDDGDASRSEVVRTAKVAKPNPMVVGTKSASSSSSSGSRQAAGPAVTHASDRRVSQYDNKATASNEQDVDRSQDAQAQYEAARKMWDDGGDTAADGSKVYRGQKAYRQYTAKSESYDNQVMQGAGPARAPVHYRATSRFDYQPDICKDYKDTGYCGYGDACIFLHDRSDYKAGWQLEKDWEDAQREKAHAAALDAFADADGKPSSSSTAGAGAGRAVDDNLPFACLICREPWHARSNPVVTRCEHYFCEACALKQAAKTKRCFVCAENTGGIFNTAKAIQEKIDRQKEAQEVVDAGDQTNESILAEYEEAKKMQRGYTGGWGIV
jgi:RING finger protein 113A